MHTHIHPGMHAYMHTQTHTYTHTLHTLSLLATRSYTHVLEHWKRCNRNELGREVTM